MNALLEISVSPVYAWHAKRCIQYLSIFSDISTILFQVLQELYAPTVDHI